MAYDAIEFDISDSVATITLDRPERLNSFNETMANEMADAWRIVRDTDDIHVAVLRANGDRAFCTGLDINEGVWWRDVGIWNQEDPAVILGPKHQRVWKPVIAAVHGMCAGGGMYFVNEADIVICSEDATFFDPHMNGGIVSALEPIGMLHRGIPLGEVLRWALMGNEERITAETALRIGLVSEVTTPDGLRRASGGDRGQHRRSQPDRRPGHGARHLGVAGHATVDREPARSVVHAHRQPLRRRARQPATPQRPATPALTCDRALRTTNRDAVDRRRETRLPSRRYVHCGWKHSIAHLRTARAGAARMSTCWSSAPASSASTSSIVPVRRASR